VIQYITVKDLAVLVRVDVILWTRQPGGGDDTSYELFVKSRSTDINRKVAVGDVPSRCYDVPHSQVVVRQLELDLLGFKLVQRDPGNVAER
jgi:hypothetical protein